MEEVHLSFLKLFSFFPVVIFGLETCCLFFLGWIIRKNNELLLGYMNLWYIRSRPLSKIKSLVWMEVLIGCEMSGILDGRHHREAILSSHLCWLFYFFFFLSFLFVLYLLLVLFISFIHKTPQVPFFVWCNNQPPHHTTRRKMKIRRKGGEEISYYFSFYWILSGSWSDRRAE